MTNIDYISYLYEDEFNEEDKEDDIFEQQFDLADIEEAVYEDEYLDFGRAAG
ncbi:hypothetical protein J4206_03965 [Candidatus Woesearchaeota archaeon]|nr:hypothetical protein [Candidatus Woesearchaeota archaeon]